MQTMNGTKISNETLEVLKNFSSINSNILVKEGNTLTTISPVKNVMAEAEISETFDQEFGIWDLNKFLGTVSLFEDPEFFFNEKEKNISKKWKIFKNIMTQKNISRKECLLLPFKTLSKALSS